MKGQLFSERDTNVNIPNCIYIMEAEEMFIEKQEPLVIGDRHFIYGYEGEKLSLFLNKFQDLHDFLKDKNRYMIDFVEHGSELFNHLIN